MWKALKKFGSHCHIYHILPSSFSVSAFFGQLYLTRFPCLLDSFQGFSGCVRFCCSSFVPFVLFSIFALAWISVCFNLKSSSTVGTLHFVLTIFAIVVSIIINIINIILVIIVVIVLIPIPILIIKSQACLSAFVTVWSGTQITPQKCIH